VGPRPLALLRMQATEPRSNSPLREGFPLRVPSDPRGLA